MLACKHACKLFVFCLSVFADSSEVFSQHNTTESYLSLSNDSEQLFVRFEWTETSLWLILIVQIRFSVCVSVYQVSFPEIQHQPDWFLYSKKSLRLTITFLSIPFCVIIPADRTFDYPALYQSDWKFTCSSMHTFECMFVCVYRWM